MLGCDAETLAIVCATCGDGHPVTDCPVYLRCPGTVIRCPSCSACEIVVVDRTPRAQLTLMAVRSLELR